MENTDTQPLQFLQARPGDAKLLTETAFKSKKIWNYTDEQMNLWADELTITETYITENKVYKIVARQNYVGFFALVNKEKCIEIEHLWLLPENRGQGYGRRAIDFIRKTAKDLNHKKLEVYADPNSNGFYAKMGGKIIRSQESKIKGRFLEVYEVEL